MIYQPALQEYERLDPTLVALQTGICIRIRNDALGTPENVLSLYDFSRTSMIEPAILKKHLDALESNGVAYPRKVGNNLQYKIDLERLTKIIEAKKSVISPSQQQRLSP
jgi:hypothetical protein